MTLVGIFAVPCPECGGPLELAPEPEGISTGLHACATCGRKYLVHLGYAIPVRSEVRSEIDRTAA
jgi:uncharacterized protein YbaR (Trm112 family)